MLFFCIKYKVRILKEESCEVDVYKRVLIKISGEALAGDKKTGLDFDLMKKVCLEIKECVDLGVQVGIVVGAGNFWRGRQGQDMDRTKADHMGMLATVMNALALADSLEKVGVSTRVQTAIEMRAFAEPYIRSRAVRHLEKGRVVIFGCGTGNPFFSTDTAAVLRAVEIDADIVLLAKNVDAIYTDDPNKNADAVKIESMSYLDILKNGLGVMDSTATSLSMDNKLPILLFGLDDPHNIVRAAKKEKIGTIVK
ncbi:MAG: UMP kinase [Ruminococcaceae bacterium]|nr:UMP kinase [Oscillospiraceae bacterium]